MISLRKLIPVMGLLFPLTLAAAEYQWLTFKMTDNSEVSVAADNLAIDYSNGALHLTSATVDESFAVDNILTMRFTSEVSGAEELPCKRHEAADYFTLSGVNAGRFESIDEARRELPSGVYVSKRGTGTIKVIF